MNGPQRTACCTKEMHNYTFTLNSTLLTILYAGDSRQDMDGSCLGDSYTVSVFYLKSEMRLAIVQYFIDSQITHIIIKMLKKPILHA